jgi:hypothetical protein
MVSFRIPVVPPKVDTTDRWSVPLGHLKVIEPTS